MASFTGNPPNFECPDFGALVVSLDFELHWGVRDHTPADGPYRENLLGARLVIPRLLQLFQHYGIAATWATVGFLFAASHDELQKFRPAIVPAYRNRQLDSYSETVGENEQDDPLHFAASLIERIRQYPRQEIATHTFSHYCCLEPGQTREAFEADLDSAIAIAGKHGVGLHSIVFPRNQVNRDYMSSLIERGIVCYRGCQRGWMYRPIADDQRTLSLRAVRLADSYMRISGPEVQQWSEVPEPNGLCNVRASRFVRPVRAGWKRLEQMRLQRIKSEMELAAKQHGIFHLWLHPHNLGKNMEENLSFFQAILEAFALLRTRYGMRSPSMFSVADHMRRQLAVVPGERPFARVAAASAAHSHA
jgi:peptidoglycan/xylan/chitin deacetylase (PgdA/CDA1 family)